MVEVKLVSGIHLCFLHIAFQNFLNTSSIGKPSLSDVFDSNFNGLERVLTPTNVQVYFIIDKVIVCTTCEILVEGVCVRVHVGVIECSIDVPRG